MLTLLSGCARTQAANSPKDSENEHLAVPTTVVTPHESLDVLELLERADEHLKSERFESAARDYKLVSETAVEKPTRLKGLFGWANALDLGGKPNEALVTYSRFVQESEAGSARNTARVRTVRLLVHLERYAEASKASYALDSTSLDSPASNAGNNDVPSGLHPGQRVLLYAARALGALAERDLSQAEINIARGRTLIEADGLDRVGVPSTDVAALYFSLGELRRLRSEEIVFDPLPADFTQALEQRCQLILDAQSAFSEAMRSNNAHWSSMSGVRVGELYQSLHTDLMAMPRPAAANTNEKKQLFEGAIRLRYSILLHKAVAMMRATVAMLERTNEQSRWREKAVESLRQIEKSEQQEAAAIDALPYSRSQLQQVLDEMSARARQVSPSK